FGRFGYSDPSAAMMLKPWSHRDFLRFPSSRPSCRLVVQIPSGTPIMDAKPPSIRRPLGQGLGEGEDFSGQKAATIANCRRRLALFSRGLVESMPERYPSPQTIHHDYERGAQWAR